MSQRTEIERFIRVWNSEADKTISVLESIPDDQYDFRPDEKGRTIGQMAWHISEIDACLSYGVAEQRFSYMDEVPHLEKRPKETKLLAPGYRRVHEASVKAIENVDNAQLDDEITFSDGRRMTIRDVLWTELLHHHIHHRGQLTILCRMAGGKPPGIYGPNREEMQAMMAKMQGSAT